MTLTVPYDQIPRKPVRWYMDGFIPIRHATVVVAPPGTSKGINVLDHAARLSRRAPAPGQAKPAFSSPRDTVAILPEDDPNEAVAWRLKGAGAITDRVHNATVLPGPKLFTLQSDIALLPSIIDQIEFEHDEKGNLVLVNGQPVPRIASDGLPHMVGLVILDPLLALSENDLRTRGQARPIIEQLEALAKQRNLIVLITHHTNANGQAASSRAIVEAARNVLTLGLPRKEASDSVVRVMTVAKTNIGQTGAKTLYQLEGTTQEPHIGWALDQPQDEAPQDLGYTVAKAKPAPPKEQYVRPKCVHIPYKACADCPLNPANAAAVAARNKPATGQAEPLVSLVPDQKTPAGPIRDLRKWRRNAA